MKFNISKLVAKQNTYLIASPPLPQVVWKESAS